MGARHLLGQIEREFQGGELGGLLLGRGLGKADDVHQQHGTVQRLGHGEQLEHLLDQRIGNLARAGADRAFQPQLHRLHLQQAGRFVQRAAGHQAAFAEHGQMPAMIGEQPHLGHGDDLDAQPAGTPADQGMAAEAPQVEEDAVQLLLQAIFGGGVAGFGGHCYTYGFPVPVA